MSTEKKVDKQRVTTPVFRVSFPQVFKAKAFEDQEAKYSVTMLFRKSTDLSALERAATAAKVAEWGADKTKWPKNLRSPFRDGNEKTDLDGYKGMIFVTAKNKHRPQVVDKDPKVQINEEDDALYAGCFARAAVRAYAYDTKGNRGVAFSLEALQKTGDGERFSGRRDASELFDEVEDMEDVEAEETDDEEMPEDDAGYSGF